MELSTCELDAQLLERFSALGTRDREELVNQLKAVIGPEISTDACRFFLELSDWNIQRAVGAYFDFSFENSPSCIPTMIDACSVGTGTSLDAEGLSLYGLRIWPSLNAKGTYESFRVNIENSGSSPWREGFFVRSESNPSTAPLVDRDPLTGAVLWLPLGPSGRIPLPPVPPNQTIELLVTVSQPPASILTALQKPIVGALSFCSASEEVFGETLYCTAIPDVAKQSWIFQCGTSASMIIKDSDTPMDEM